MRIKKEPRAGFGVESSTGYEGGLLPNLVQPLTLGRQASRFGGLGAFAFIHTVAPTREILHLSKFVSKYTKF